MCAVVTADRGFTWSDEETSVLLRLWGANDAQSELTGNKRNFVVYEKISEKMNNMGYVRTASQCREKIKRMKREYTLTKQYNDRTDGPKKRMRFYDKFERILLEKQNKNLKNTTLRLKMCRRTGELLDESQRSKKRKKNKSERRTKNITPKSEEYHDQEGMDSQEKDVENAWTPDILLVEGEEAPALENQSSLSASSLYDPMLTKKRKITTKMSFLQCMMDSLTFKFMKYQNESDARFLDKIEQLEQERIKMDEKIQKMWLDFEERRRADEREHELNVMTTFQEILNEVKISNVKEVLI